MADATSVSSGLMIISNRPAGAEYHSVKNILPTVQITWKVNEARMHLESTASVCSSSRVLVKNIPSVAVLCAHKPYHRTSTISN